MKNEGRSRTEHRKKYPFDPLYHQPSATSGVDVKRPPRPRVA